MSASTSDGEHGVCPIVEAVKKVGNRWRLIILRYLVEGPKRFNELLKLADGIDAKTLSRTLRYLEEEGLIRREVISTRPFSVRYSLTEQGLDLMPVLEALRGWGERWLLRGSNRRLAQE